MDEGRKQLLSDKREPLPMKSGQLERFDNEYERHGTISVFMACEPLAGAPLVGPIDSSKQGRSSPCARAVAESPAGACGTTTRRQGKPRLTTRTEVDEAIKAVLKQFRVEGLLQVQSQEDVHERPVRAYRGRLSGVRRDLTFRLSYERVETAIARAMSQLG